MQTFHPACEGAEWMPGKTDKVRPGGKSELWHPPGCEGQRCSWGIGRTKTLRRCLHFGYRQHVRAEKWPWIRYMVKLRGNFSRQLQPACEERGCQGQWNMSAWGSFPEYFLQTGFTWLHHLSLFPTYISLGPNLNRHFLWDHFPTELGQLEVRPLHRSGGRTPTGTRGRPHSRDGVNSQRENREPASHVSRGKEPLLCQN